MVSGFRFVLAVVPAVCLAQTPDLATNQKVLEELKGIRTALNRLTQLMETMEKGQKAELALRRIQVYQVYENRLTALEAQRVQLSSQEQDAEKQVAAATDAIRSEEAAPPTVLRSIPGSKEGVFLMETRSRLTEATRTLEEIRRRRQTVEQEIAGLKSRIAGIEKYLEDALR